MNDQEAVRAIARVIYAVEPRAQKSDEGRCEIVVQGPLSYAFMASAPYEGASWSAALSALSRRYALGFGPDVGRALDLARSRAYSVLAVEGAAKAFVDAYTNEQHARKASADALQRFTEDEVAALDFKCPQEVGEGLEAAAKADNAWAALCKAAGREAPPSTADGEVERLRAELVALKQELAEVLDVYVGGSR